jgi:hypothetical protein
LHVEAPVGFDNLYQKMTYNHHYLVKNLSLIRGNQEVFCFFINGMKWGFCLLLWGWAWQGQDNTWGMGRQERDKKITGFPLSWKGP